MAIYTLEAPQLFDALSDTLYRNKGRSVLVTADKQLIGYTPERAGEPITFRVRLEEDDDTQPPWERSEGHGRVSLFKGRSDKKPGERPMHCSNSGLDRYYDWSEAVRRAREEGWRPHDLTDEQAATMTKGQIALAAVQEDFERMRDWCHDEWRYLGIIVEVAEPAAFRYNPRRVESEFESSVWGVESDWAEGIVDHARELIAELLHTIDGYRECPHCKGEGHVPALTEV